MTNKLRTYALYPGLTIEQAIGVQRDYPRVTDPWGYEYEIDPMRGEVTDRFYLSPGDRQRLQAERKDQEK